MIIMPVLFSKYFNLSFCYFNFLSPLIPFLFGHICFLESLAEPNTSSSFPKSYYSNTLIIGDNGLSYIKKSVF